MSDYLNEVQICFQAVYLLLTVIVVFCVCWTPQQSLLLWDVFRDRTKVNTCLANFKICYYSWEVNPMQTQYDAFAADGRVGCFGISGNF